MGYDDENILNFDHQYLQMKEIIKLMQLDKYKMGIHLEKDYNFIKDLYKKYNIIDEKLNVKDLYTNDLIESAE